MQNFQYSLFYDLQHMIETSNFYKKYYLLFNALDLSGFPDKNYSVGRTGYSRQAMLRAFIIKNLEEIKSVPRLLEFLDAHPILTHMAGFEPGALPDETQFYRFLKETPNSFIEKVHLNINKQLVEKEVVSLDTFLMDSKPIMAATKHNNFKNPKRNTTRKKKLQKETLPLLWDTTPIKK